MSGVLGLVTIGQTPRADLEAAFRDRLPRTEVRVSGALDGMPEGEIEGLASRPGRYPLHTLLADGTTRDIDLTSLAPLVEAKARQLANDGARVVAVCCAGGFPEFECGVPVLMPGKLLPGIAGAVCRSRRVGIVSPIAAQMKPAREKWERDGFSVRTASASPYRHDEISGAARAMSESDVELVVLDCIGHGAAYRAEFMRLSGRPVLSAQTLLASVAAEIMGA